MWLGWVRGGPRDFERPVLVVFEGVGLKGLDSDDVLVRKITAE